MLLQHGDVCMIYYGPDTVIADFPAPRVFVAAYAANCTPYDLQTFPTLPQSGKRLIEHVSVSLKSTLMLQLSHTHWWVQQPVLASPSWLRPGRNATGACWDGLASQTTYYGAVTL